MKKCKYKWMIKAGDIYYSKKEDKYFLVIGADWSGRQVELDFHDACVMYAYHELYDGIEIVFVELLNNKNYKKSIQTQPLIEFSVFCMKHCSMKYDRHINISQYMADILKRRLIDNSFSDVKDVYFKRYMKILQYIKPGIAFLEHIPMYQNIIINDNNTNDSAVYLGVTVGKIMYYSRQEAKCKEMEFKKFKTVVTLDKGLLEKNNRYMPHGEDIQELKETIQIYKFFES